MAFSKIFWLSILTLIGLMIAQSYGYSLMNYIIITIIISIVALKISKDSDGSPYERILSDLSFGITKIGTSFTDLTNFLKEKNSSLETPKEMITLGSIDSALKRHQEEIKTEVNDSFDKMAKKMIEFENKISDMRMTFSAGIGALDERLANVEGPEEIEENKDEAI